MVFPSLSPLRLAHFLAGFLIHPFGRKRFRQREMIGWILRYQLNRPSQFDQRFVNVSLIKQQFSQTTMS